MILSHPAEVPIFNPVKPRHRWKVPQHAEQPVEPTNWNVLQRPLSLVSFISRVPAGNGSL
jgi:hypothetical protein